MSNTECRYLCSPDILVVPGCTKYTVRIDFSTVEGDVVRAGTPINRAGKIANDSTAFGILLRDTWRQSPYAKICIDGFIDYALAQEHSGVTLSAEAKAVLRNINFVGDPEAASGGGSGGSAGGGGVTSWNDLTDRPFGDYHYEIPVILDPANEFNCTPENAGAMVFYYLPGVTIPANVEVTVHANPITYDDGTYEESPSVTAETKYVESGNYTLFEQGLGRGSNCVLYVICTHEDNVEISIVGGYTVLLPKSGTYITRPKIEGDWYVYGDFCPNTLIFDELVTLSEKFLPPAAVTEDEIISKGFVGYTRSASTSSNDYITALDNEVMGFGSENNGVFACTYYVLGALMPEPVSAWSDAKISIDGDNFTLSGTPFYLPGYGTCEYIVLYGNGNLYNQYAGENNDFGEDSTDYDFCVILHYQRSARNEPAISFFTTRTGEEHTVSFSYQSDKTFVEIPIEYIQKMPKIAHAEGGNVTAEKFNELIDLLINAGYMV